MTAYRLGRATVMVGDPHVTTRFDDGGEVVAAVAPQPGQAEIAARLGITVEAMNRGHDLAHSVVAVMLGLDASPTLHAVAHGRRCPFWWREEGAVLELQALAATLGISIADIARRYAT